MSIQPLYERVAAGEGCSDIVSHLPVLRQMVVDVDAQTAKVIGVPNNVKAIPVHCTSRIDVLDLLNAFEAGADGVAVVRCGSGTCKNRDIEPRVNARVKRAQELLAAIGIDKARMEVLSSSPDGNEKPYVALTAEFSERVKAIVLRTK